MPEHHAHRDRDSARPRSRLGRLIAHPRLAPLLSILLGGLLAQTFGRPQLGAWSILILALWIGLLWADPQSTRSKISSVKVNCNSPCMPCGLLNSPILYTSSFFIIFE